MFPEKIPMLFFGPKQDSQIRCYPGKTALLLALLLVASGAGAQDLSGTSGDIPTFGGPPPGDISSLDLSGRSGDIGVVDATDVSEENESPEGEAPDGRAAEALRLEDAEAAEAPSGSLEANSGILQPATVLLDLVGAQRQALARNPSLAAGAERVEQARQYVAKARSMYFPQIDLTYRYTFTWLPSEYTEPINEYLDETDEILRTIRHELYAYYVTSSTLSLGDRRTIRQYLNDTEDVVDMARDFVESPQESSSVNLTAGWLLFDGFAREFTNAMAKHGYGEARAAYRDGQRILLDAIAQAYYGGQYAREQVTIAESAITFFTRLVKEAQARRKIGRGPTSHVLNFETALYASKANLLRARREYELARIAMAVLLGYPEGYLPDTVQLAPLESETPETMMLPEKDAMLALAYAYRPDMEQRELGLKRAQANVRREYAKFTPQIALFAAAQTTNIDETGFSGDRMLSTVGINASMNLFSGGRRRAELREAKHARRESEWQVTETEQKIAAEVQRALLDLKMAQESLQLSRNAAECVRKNRDLVDKEYKAGKAMLVQLNQAQNDFVQAMGTLAQARVGLQRSWQVLHHATGISLGLLDGEHQELTEKTRQEAVPADAPVKENSNE